MKWFLAKKEQANTEPQAEESAQEEVTSTTKLKIVGALLLVGLSAGVAWWVQDSGNMSQDLNSIKADVLAESKDTQASETLSEAVTDTLQGQEEPASQESENGFTQEVTISNFAFTPSQITIEKGQTVRWKNNDSVAHTVTGPDFTSTTLNSGDSFTYTFHDDATIEYHCSFHPQMKGTIVVGSGAELHASALESTEEIDLSDLTTTSVSALGDSEMSEIKENVFPAALEESPVTPPISQPSDNSLEAPPSQEVHETQQTPAALEGGKLAQSGPEDWLYVGLGGVVLYVNRKKLFAIFGA